jgi:hypothetical protein
VLVILFIHTVYASTIEGKQDFQDWRKLFEQRKESDGLDGG